MNPVIEATNLSKRYGSFEAVKNASFTIDKGRIVGLIGPNGAGKTSILKAILGLSTFSGELSVLGMNPMRQRHELMKQVCFIADVAVLPKWLKVSQALDFVEGVHPRFNREKAEHFLARTKIKRNKKVKELSKGMVTQLHLALIMAIEVDLLVLDEPTLGLDIIYSRTFYDELLGEYFEEQRTILITTHQVSEVENLLTDLLFVKDGQIVLDSSMDDLQGRFWQVLVSKDQAEEARKLSPLTERDLLGKKLFLFDGVDKQTLAQFGELHKPSVSDLFVATMQEEVA